MNVFDLIAPVYEKIISGADKTFSILTKIGDFEECDKILDLGGGTGRVSRLFVKKVKEVVVLDASLGMVESCKKHQDISCVLGKAENIPFGDGYFDKVIIIDAFHHFQDQEKAVREIRRVLRKNGKVIIEELNFKEPVKWLVEKLERIVGAKSRLLPPELLAEFFEKDQFKTTLFGKTKTTYYLVGEKAEGCLPA